jgi:hypothetical protein
MGQKRRAARQREQALQREQARLSQGPASTIDVPVENVTESSTSYDAVQSAASEETARTAVPRVLKCSVVASPTSVSVRNVDLEHAEVRVGRSLLGYSLTHVYDKTTKMLIFGVIAPKPTSDPVPSRREWIKKWLTRLGALTLWILFTSPFFGEIGLVGGLLQGLGIATSWEPLVLWSLIATLLLASLWLTLGEIIKIAAYVFFAPVVILFVILAKIFGGMLLVGRLARLLSSLRVGVAVIIFMIVSAAIVSKSQTTEFLCVSEHARRWTRHGFAADCVMGERGDAIAAGDWSGSGFLM